MANKQFRSEPFLRIRVRCEENHPDPWLRQLYVLWRPPAAPGFDDTQFHVAQTDHEGYLGPIPPVVRQASDETWTDPEKTLAMVIRNVLPFYFVRHPDIRVVMQLLRDLNEDYEGAIKSYGDPHPLMVEAEITGKDKKHEEGVIHVPQSPDFFLPRGSDLYEGWVLYRDMPGTGNNYQKSDVQCPILGKLVRHLQFHLGELRYPVGSHGHPYSPEPFPKDDYRLYPNEGIFDVKTWNAVQAFQSDAKAGMAVPLGPDRPPPFLGPPPKFEPPATHGGIRDWVAEAKRSRSFRSGKPEPLSTKNAKRMVHPAVVDKATGDGIQQWLTDGFRKPGRIYKCWDSISLWMGEDALPAVQALAQDLRNRKAVVPEPFEIICGLRDACMITGSGQSRVSNHKSGYAFDLLADSFVLPHPKMPLFRVRVREGDGYPDRVFHWTIYCLVPKAGNEKADIALEDSIEPWVYSWVDPKGGRPMAPNPPFAKYKFLNFTRLAEKHGLYPISSQPCAFGSPTETEQHVLDSHTAFLTVLGRLNGLAASSAAMAKTLTKMGKSLPGVYPDPDVSAYLSSYVAEVSKEAQTIASLADAPIVINGAPSMPLSELKPVLAALSQWSGLARKQGFRPTPDVEIDKPSGKSAERLFSALRGKVLKGHSIEILGAEGAESSETVELTASAKFPKEGPYTLRLMTNPLVLKQGDTLEIPHAKLGNIMCQEWWHFNYKAGLEAVRNFGPLLGCFGWTQEGLLGTPSHYGHSGVGYTQGDFDKKSG